MSPAASGRRFAVESASLRLEVLRQLQGLRLVVRADGLAVELARPRQHLFVDQAADGLAVLEDERHLARAHFEHGARAAAAGARIAETGIEEAGVMHPELADKRIERHHLGGVIGRHLHGLLGRQNVELVGIENEVAVVAGRARSAITRVNTSSRPVELFGLAAAASPGGSARLSINGTIYTHPVSSTAPSPRSISCSLRSSMRSATVACRPGKKLARTRNAMSASLRSRLAG